MIEHHLLCYRLDNESHFQERLLVSKEFPSISHFAFQNPLSTGPGVEPVKGSSSSQSRVQTKGWSLKNNTLGIWEASGFTGDQSRVCLQQIQTVV